MEIKEDIWIRCLSLQNELLQNVAAKTDVAVFYNLILAGAHHPSAACLLSISQTKASTKWRRTTYRYECQETESAGAILEAG